MSQTRFSSSGNKVSPEKLMSNPAYNSIQSANMPLEADFEVLYANPFCGEDPVPMSGELKKIFNDPNLTMTAPNFRAQLEQIMNQYDGDSGPWSVDGSDGLIVIHNKKLTSQTETLYRYQDENGEVLKIQITTNWVSVGGGQSVVGLSGGTKSIYGSTNLDPTLEDELNQYLPQDDGLNLSKVKRSEGDVQFATRVQTKNRYAAIKHPDRNIVRELDGTSNQTLINQDAKNNQWAISQYSHNDIFLKRMVDSIQAMIQRSGFTGVQTGLLRMQLLDYIKTGQVGSVLGLILNKQIPLAESQKFAENSPFRFTYTHRLRYQKRIPKKGRHLIRNNGGKHRDKSTDVIFEEIVAELKNSASNYTSNSGWKINGKWYTDAQVRALARQRSKSPDGSGRMGKIGSDRSNEGIYGIYNTAEQLITKVAKEASKQYFITNATIQGSKVEDYGDYWLVTVDISGNAPVKVTVKDMINIMAQRDGSPIAMLRQSNLLRNSNKRAKRKEIEVQMVVVGNPLLSTGQTIQIANIGKKYSGNWFIKTCIHKLDSNGFTTSLTLNKASGNTGVTVSTVVPTQGEVKTNGKPKSGSSKATVIPSTSDKPSSKPKRTDNYNSGDIQLLQSVGASGDTKTMNQMAELLKYEATHSTSDEPLYEVSVDDVVYNYNTGHSRPLTDDSKPKVRMTQHGKQMYEQMLKDKAKAAEEKAKRAKKLSSNLLKRDTSGSFKPKDTSGHIIPYWGNAKNLAPSTGVTPPLLPSQP